MQNKKLFSLNVLIIFLANIFLSNYVLADQLEELIQAAIKNNPEIQSFKHKWQADHSLDPQTRSSPDAKFIYNRWIVRAAACPVWSTLC